MTSILSQDVQADRHPPADAAVIVAIEESAIAGFARRMVAAIASARPSAAVGRVIGRRISAARSSTIEERIRFSAVALLTGVVVHLVMTRFSEPSNSIVARSIWAAIAMSLALTAVNARHVANAWVNWPGRSGH